MPYVATFFSHFGATRFRRECRQAGIACELAPVPRTLSSSCGTCALFSDLPCAPQGPWADEVEIVAARAGQGNPGCEWEELYRAEGA